MNRTPDELREAFGFLSRGELELLRELTIALPIHPIIVNIGAGAGTSTSTFLHARHDAKVYSVDIQQESSPYGSFEGEQTALREMGLLDHARYFPILGDSKLVGKRWEHGQVDFIFVDGDHSYSGCYDDIRAWMPHLKDGGLMAVHDYERDVWPEVQGATDTAMKELGCKQIHHVDTLIVFQK